MILLFAGIWDRLLPSEPSIFKPVASLYLVKAHFTLQAQLLMLNLADAVQGDSSFQSPISDTTHIG